MHYKYDVTFRYDVKSGIWQNTDCIEVIAINEAQALALVIYSVRQLQYKLGRIIKIELVEICDNMGMTTYKKGND